MSRIDEPSDQDESRMFGTGPAFVGPTHASLFSRQYASNDQAGHLVVERG